MQPQGATGRARRAAISPFVKRAVLLAIVVAGVAAAAIPARATYGAQTTADEPQYLLTAVSLVDDLDLDIGDELADEAYLDFHELRPNEQTFELDESGRRISPHDPLLPVLIAPAMAAGGWVGVKLFLAVLAGATAALTAWVAVRRLQADETATWVVVGAAFVGMPLTSYGTQVYPELPAALCVVALVGALLAPDLARRHLLVVAVGLVALPWLSVKYAPVVVVLALVAVWRLVDARQFRALGCLAVWGALSAAWYLWFRQAVYGGWTVYAAGDHFIERGEFAVVGGAPDYVGRTRRIFGLLVDRRYGLVGWSPIWLLAPAGVAWVLVDRTRAVWQRLTVAAPLAAGWATASFIALSMHSWWTPGRQIVVVAPLAVLAIAALATRLRWLLAPIALAGLVAAGNWLWLAWEASTGRRTIVVDFFETEAPAYRLMAPLLAQGWSRTDGADAIRTIWIVVLAASVIAVVALGARGTRRRRAVSAAAAALAVVAALGWLGADDGELTRPAEIYRPSDHEDDD